MMVRVTFAKADEVLAAVVRALVAKAAGLQAVSGTNERLLHQQGFYEFELNGRRFDKFKEWTENYIADDYRKLIRMSNG